MIREVNAVKFRQNLGEMIAHVQYENDSVIVKKSGKPVVAMIDTDLFERIQNMKDEFDRLSAKVASDYKDVPEKEGMQEIEELVYVERKGKKK